MNDSRRRRDAVDDRVFVVAAGKIVLRTVRGQIFDEPDGVIAVGRALDDTRATDIDMGAITALVGKDHADPVGDRVQRRVIRCCVAGEIIGVDDGDGAIAIGNRLHIAGVVALGRAGEIRDDAIGPVLRLVGTVMADDRCHQGDIIDVGRGPHADLALMRRIGKVGIAGELLGLAGFLVVDDHPRALGQAEPQTVRMTQIGRNAVGEDIGLDAVQNSRFLGAPEPAGIDRDQDIGRAVFPFADNPLDQRIGACLDQIDPDAGLLGEILIQRQIGIVMARGIDIDATSHLCRRCIGVRARRRVFASLPAGSEKSGKGDQGQDGSLHDISLFDVGRHLIENYCHSQVV